MTGTTITPEQTAILRAPFTPQAVKFRLDAKEPRNGQVRCVVYIDASLAADRLGAVDPGWSTDYKVIGTAAEHSPVLCTLTVLGVTRQGVGQYAQNKADDKHMKSAFSDALKRAAVEFGVGAYLRSMPQFRVSEGGVWKAGQKLGGINDAGLAQLRKQYEGFIGNMELIARFGPPIDHGDIVRPDAGQVETEAVIEAAAAEPLTDEQAAILGAIATKCGHSFDPDGKLAEDFDTHLASFLAYAVKNKAVSDEDAATIKHAATALDVDDVVARLGVDLETGEVAA